MINLRNTKHMQMPFVKCSMKHNFNIAKMESRVIPHAPNKRDHSNILRLHLQFCDAKVTSYSRVRIMQLHSEIVSHDLNGSYELEKFFGNLMRTLL
uniref:Uncharacterized protein n=1 Tax=Parascaris univalens TaxID=6257 RepID=A0A915A583_PARUN